MGFTTYILVNLAVLSIIHVVVMLPRGEKGSCM